MMFENSGTRKFVVGTFSAHLVSTVSQICSEPFLEVERTQQQKNMHMLETIVKISIENNRA